MVQNIGISSWDYGNTFSKGNLSSPWNEINLPIDPMLNLVQILWIKPILVPYRHGVTLMLFHLILYIWSHPWSNMGLLVYAQITWFLFSLHQMDRKSDQTWTSLTIFTQKGLQCTTNRIFPIFFPSLVNFCGFFLTIWEVFWIAVTQFWDYLAPACYKYSKKSRNPPQHYNFALLWSKI